MDSGAPLSVTMVCSEPAPDSGRDTDGAAAVFDFFFVMLDESTNVSLLSHTCSAGASQYFQSGQHKSANSVVNPACHVQGGTKNFIEQRWI